MSWLYKYFRLVLGETYPALQLHDATLKLSGTGATLTLASGATVNEFSTDGTLSGNSDTAVPTEKAVKTYVDTTATGIKWKAPVRVATTTNGTLATAFANGQTVDGITLATGDRILLKDQSDQTANGIYTVNATGAPTRATDADTGAEILGCVVAVLEGTTNEDSAWCNTNSTTITIGSSNITFAIFAGLKAGTNISLTADVIDVTALNFDSVTALAGSGTPIIKIGSLDGARASTAVANFIPVQVSINQTADIGSGNTVGATYFRTVTGIAQTGQLATDMVRTSIGHNVFDAYGVQSHMSITANMGTTNANAHLTAISGKITLTNTPTVATGWGTAGLFIIEGAGTFSQMCHVVSAVCEAGVTAVQSLFHAYTDSTVNAAFQCSGTTNMTHLFDFDAQAGCVGASDIHIDIAGSNGYIPWTSSAAQFVTLSGAQALTNKTLSLSGATLLTESGTPVFTFGSLDTAYTSTKTATLIPVQVRILQNADIGSGNTCGAGYFRCSTGLAQTGQIASLMSRAYVSHNIFDAYSLQAHLTIDASMATVNDNAHLTGVSGKLTLTSTPTVSKGWGTAGLFIIEGAGTFSQMCSVVSLVQESGASAAQEMLYINNDGTATKGIYYVGNFTKGIDFSGGTFSQGYANACLAYGDINTTKSITPTDSVIPYQCNITSIADSGTSGDQTVGATYFRTACTTASQPNHQLATAMVRTAISQNIWDAYGLQSHMGISASMQTTGDNAHLTAISGKITFTNSPTVAKGWITAGLFIIEGAGTVTQMCHGVSIVEEAGSTGAQSLLHLNTDVGTTPYFSFSGADGTGKSIYSHTAAGTQDGTIKVLINGTPKWIPFMQAE